MDIETMKLLAEGGTPLVLMVVGTAAVRYLMTQIAEQKKEIQVLQERILAKETDNDKKQNGMLRTLIEMTHKDSRQLATLVANNTEAINRFNDSQNELIRSQNVLIKAVEALTSRVLAIEETIKAFRSK